MEHLNPELFELANTHPWLFIFELSWRMILGTVILIAALEFTVWLGKKIK